MARKKQVFALGVSCILKIAASQPLVYVLPFLTLKVVKLYITADGKLQHRKKVSVTLHLKSESVATSRVPLPRKSIFSKVSEARY